MIDEPDAPDGAGEAVVNMQHLRSLGYCSGGVREFFARHGLDYTGFLANGIGEAELIATGDAMAFDAIEEAKNGRKF